MEDVILFQSFYFQYLRNICLFHAGCGGDMSVFKQLDSCLNISKCDLCSKSVCIICCMSDQMRWSSPAQGDSIHLLPPLDPGDRTPRNFQLTFPLESVWSVSMATHSLRSPLPSSRRCRADRAVSRRQSRVGNGAVMLSFYFEASELFAREMLIYWSLTQTCWSVGQMKHELYRFDAPILGSRQRF